MHQKFESFKKKFSRRQNSNSNLLINSKKNPKSFEFISGGIVVGKLVKWIETGGPHARKKKKKNETGDGRVGELVKKIQMNDPTVGKAWKLEGFGQERCKKPEQEATLPGAGEEDGFIKCYDDTTGKELPWQAVEPGREKELKYLRELGVYEKVDERAAVAKYSVTQVDTTWVDTDTAFEEEPMQIRARTVAREFKSGDKPDLYAGTLSAGSF